VAGPENEGSSPGDSVVRSVDRAAALLLALGDGRGQAGVTELARRLGLHKSTASRLLATLERRGLVDQDRESGKYRIGVAVIRLAEQAERTLDLAGIAMPELERLTRAIEEGVALAVLEDGAAVRLSPRRVRGRPERHRGAGRRRARDDRDGVRHLGAGPRLTPHRMAELAALARSAAVAISERLGRVPA